MVLGGIALNMEINMDLHHHHTISSMSYQPFSLLLEVYDRTKNNLLQCRPIVNNTMCLNCVHEKVIRGTLSVSVNTDIGGILSEPSFNRVQ